VIGTGEAAVSVSLAPLERLSELRHSERRFFLPNNITFDRSVTAVLDSGDSATPWKDQSPNVFVGRANVIGDSMGLIALKL